MKSGVSNGIVTTDASISDSKVDNALTFLQQNEQVSHVLSKDEEKKLVRKIDLMLMPLMAAVFTIQYLDKTIINYARVMGISQDTHTSASQFSYLATAFYVGYLVCEIPNSYLIQKLPVAKYLGASIIAWGICVTLNCASSNYTTLVALRVLLGCFESAVSPGLILITSMWYKKTEQPLRVGLWFSTGGLAIIIGSLSSYGLQFYESKAFRSWQILFLICGVITIVIGILVVLFLPDNPMSSRLSAEEKIQAIERVRSNKTGIENKCFIRAQMIEALLDPHVWLIIVLMITATEVNGALANYQASLIKSFGFSSKESALLSVPSGVLSIIVCISSAWIAGRTDQRLLTLMGYYPLGIIGASLMAFLSNNQKGWKLVGNYLTNMVPNAPLIYTVAAANFSGHTKKVTVNAIVLISSSIGNIIGPLTFTGATAPNFVPAKITMMACFSTALVLVFLLRSMFVWENSKRNRKGEENLTPDSEFMNLTDRENRGFRYSL